MPKPIRACLFSIHPVPGGLSRRQSGFNPSGSGAWRILHRLLLGADATPVHGRRDEPPLDRCSCRARARREGFSQRSPPGSCCGGSFLRCRRRTHGWNLVAGSRMTDVRFRPETAGPKGDYVSTLRRRRRPPLTSRAPLPVAVQCASFAVASQRTFIEGA
jgi:hypothetical protein